MKIIKATLKTIGTLALILILIFIGREFPLILAWIWIVLSSGFVIVTIFLAFYEE
jgi:hypothetical protein